MTTLRDLPKTHRVACFSDSVGKVEAMLVDGESRSGGRAGN